MQHRTSWLLAAAFAILGAVSAPDAAAQEAKSVEKNWKAKCASCHGPDGKGKTKQGDKMGVGDMTSATWQKEFTDDKMKTAIMDGFKREKNGKNQEMKGMKEKLKPEEVDALIAFIRTLK
jgi:mono/diheme cytochrome c family protein